jgi:hypothetical protein
MQTNASKTVTWQPPAVGERRPDWAQLLLWYAVGLLSTLAGGVVTIAIAAVLRGPSAWLFGQALTVAGIVVLIKRCNRLPRRSTVALVLGVLTPFVLAAIVLVLFLWALAHSTWTF